MLKDRKVTPGRRTAKALQRRRRWLQRQAGKEALADRFGWISGHRGSSTSKGAEVGIGGINRGGKGKKRRRCELHFAMQ